MTWCGDDYPFAYEREELLAATDARAARERPDPSEYADTAVSDVQATPSQGEDET